MSSFTEPLHVEFLERGDKAKLLKEFSYYTGEGVTYTVPVGFITDFGME